MTKVLTMSPEQYRKLRAIDAEIEQNRIDRAKLWERWSQLQVERKEIISTIIRENGNPEAWVIDG